MLVRSTTKAREDANAHLDCWRGEESSIDELRAFLGGSDAVPSMLASDMGTRLIAARQLVNSAVQCQVEHPERHWYHVTMIDDRWRTLEREPHIDLFAIKKTARAMMANAGFHDWFGVVEILPLIKWVGGRGRTLCPHAHLMVSSPTAIHRSEIEAGMRASSRLETFEGAPTIVISERQGQADVAHALAYLLKGIDRGGNQYRVRRHPDRPQQRDAAMRPDQALRILEVLSHIRITDLLMSSGRGLLEFMAPLRRVLRQQGCVRLEPQLVAQRWADARVVAGKSSYRTPVITLTRR